MSGVHLLVFWSVFDRAARIQVLEAERVRARYRDVGLEVLGISTDGEAMKETVARVVRDLRLSFPVCMDPSGPDEAAMLGVTYGVRISPTTFVVDRNGRIGAVHEGFAPEQMLAQTLRAVLDSAGTE